MDTSTHPARKTKNLPDLPECLIHKILNMREPHPLAQIINDIVIFLNYKWIVVRLQEDFFFSGDPLWTPPLGLCDCGMD